MPQDYFKDKLRGHSFKAESLEGANFNEADIRGANFTRVTNLTGANFNKADIRGANFTGVNLTGANFNEADIRGANFTGVNLTGANFSCARAGLTIRRAIFAVAGTLAVAVAGTLAGTVAVAIAVIGAIVVFVPVVGAKAVVGSEIVAGTLAGGVAEVVVGGVAGGGAVAVAAAVTGAGAEALAGAVAVVGGVAIIVAVIGAVSVAEALAETEAVAVAEALTETGTGTGAVAGAVVVVLAVVLSEAVSVVAIVNLVKFIVKAQASVQADIVAGTGAVVVVVAGALILLSTYISWQALKGEPKLAQLYDIIVFFGAIGGTTFHNADLTDADFTEATLKSTDFRKAVLTRTCFYKTKKLDHVLPGSTYLQTAKVRKLLINKSGFINKLGENEKFDNQNLCGINLKDAKLTDTDFSGANLKGATFQGATLKNTNFITANLNEVNLQDADLSMAKLVQTQLFQTDFTNATLTGAYIQDWGLTRNTKLDGVQCKYVYMRLPTNDNPDANRLPYNNEEFAFGEFINFIKPIFHILDLYYNDTLDLYYNQDVNSQAIAISFKELAETNPDAKLEILAIEKRGKDNFLLRAKTAPYANKARLIQEYDKIYRDTKSLPEEQRKESIVTGDIQTCSLEKMVQSVRESSDPYLIIQNSIIKIQIDNMTRNSNNFSVGRDLDGGVNNVQGGKNRAIQGDNNQGVLGDSNQVKQQNQADSNTEVPITKDDIIKLLAKLEILVKEAELPEKLKEEVIDEISAVKKATDKEEPNKKTGISHLESVAETLAQTSKTVDAGQKLWDRTKPIIIQLAKWFGVAAGSYFSGWIGLK